MVAEVRRIELMAFLQTPTQGSDRYEVLEAGILVLKLPLAGNLPPQR